MSGLTDLLTIVFNSLFVFAIVSFVSSAATDGLAAIFRRRETLLARAVAQLLDDKRFDGLALEVYNNPLINPLVNGTARSKAELGSLPAWIDPAAFATALLEALHIIPSTPAPVEKIQPLPVDGTLPDATRIENAITNATRRIEADAEDNTKARNLIRLVTNLIRRCEGRAHLMEQSVAFWFDTAMRTVTEQYRKEITLWNFVIGFGIAALLDLQPIPVGGLLSKGAAQQGAQVAQMVPVLVNLFEWAVVASSTLFGSQVWFSLLRFAVSRGGGESTAMPDRPPPTDAASSPGQPAGSEGARPRGRAPARRKSPASATTTPPGPQSAP